MSGVPPTGGGQRSRDSSLSLSPVPSPHNAVHDNIIVNPFPHAFSDNGVPATTSHVANAKNTINGPPAEKVKRPRKKKDPTDDTSTDPPKEKKPRKPRTSNPDGTAAARKKQQKAAADAAASMSAPAFTQPSAVRQPAISELLSRPPQQPQPPKASLASLMAPVVKVESAGLSPAAAPVRPVSSGQRYDPIRGLTMDAPPPPPPPTQIPRQQPPPPPVHSGFTSSSPSLASLMNPTATLPQTVPRPSQYTPPMPQQPTFMPSQTQLSPSAPLSLASTASPVKSDASLGSAAGRTIVPQPAVKPVTDTTQMDLDTEHAHPLLKTQQLKTAEEKPTSKQSSAAATPKEKRNSPPRPTGSGLLSSSDLFGGATASDDGKTRKGVDINITIQLNPNGGNTINIAQEIMKKYGRDAINPRAAAHRERLLQVAAAANRLEQGSGDDMSLDGSDGADDSNIEMGGMGDDRSTAGEGPDGDKPRKRRRRKAEDYDKEDDFIDDTEMAWQESAAVAKDGFFVYSGPLIRKEEKAAIERAATSTRGRGRGRARARAATASSTTHASVATAKAAEGSSPSSTASAARGKGRGRGGTTGTTRKPKPKPQLSQLEREHLPSLEHARQEALSKATAV